MPRPQKPRWVGFDPEDICFVPHVGPPPIPIAVFLTVDEVEALRLADLSGMNHEQAAEEMHVSRATFGRILARARAKTADALVNGKSIGVREGVVRYSHGRGPGPHRGPRGGGQSGRHGFRGGR